MIEPVAKDQRKLSYYIFEKIPPIIFISILVIFLVGGFWFPEIISYFIILINIYFIYRSASVALFFAIAYYRIRQAELKDWRGKLESFKNKANFIQLLTTDLEKIISSKFTKFNSKQPSWLQKYMFTREKTKMTKFLKSEIKNTIAADQLKPWNDIQHIVIIPHVKEPEHILRETLENLKKQTFPLQQINIVLAAEARDENGYPLSIKLAAEFKDSFNHIWISNHILKDEEIVGKSSNMKAGGQLAFEEVTKLGWDLKKVLVTSCDADSKLPPQYLSYVTYEFITLAESEYKFFNASIVFYNNIWRLPFYARVKNSMSSLFIAARLIRVDKLIPFSTYTTSFWLIKEIGFWTPWVTPEDFHLFFKAQFKFGHRVSVIPIFLRIMSDAAEGTGHLDTIKNNYQQERRWAWGISDDGWVLQNVVHDFFKHDFITIYRALHAIFDHVFGPLIGIVIIIGGNLPPLLNPQFRNTVLGAQLPIVSSTIISSSLFFLIILIILDLSYKPKRNDKNWIYNLPIQIIEWVTLPWAGFILTVLPGIEANTRLLFGRYLEYYVTKKK